MLLKVLMDFRGFQIREKAHAPTHINKQERIITIIIIKHKIIKLQYNNRANHLVRGICWELKGNYKTISVKSIKIEKQFALMVVQWSWCNRGAKFISLRAFQ